ncbi:hypothetical protein ACSTG8_23470, partial [Vibrio parahaemolyticus]
GTVTPVRARCHVLRACHRACASLQDLIAALAVAAEAAGKSGAFFRPILHHLSLTLLPQHHANELYHSDEAQRELALSMQM